ncbi:hypothetical protein [Stenotrophomonas maltophilia]|uniref:hypothetical protein n=1 Tax=Stenotrophomonas maltophilia TaxID=40324 RepID=UPI0039C1D6BA
MAPIAPSLAGLQQVQVRRNGAGKSTAISGLLRLRRPGGAAHAAGRAVLARPRLRRIG